MFGVFIIAVSLLFSYTLIVGVLKSLVQLREMKLQNRTGRRKKQKNALERGSVEGSASVASFVLLWDDPATNNLIGDRGDCVWIAEQLWNISNQLFGLNSSTSSGARGFAADTFAASHDFCLLSEEEEGQCLSKGYLDYDVKFDPAKTLLPTFEGSHRPPCDISSEVSL